MTRQLAESLEFDTVLNLVAAHARSRVGRSRVTASPHYLAPDTAARRARLTEQVAHLTATDGAFPLAELDAGGEWLDPDAAPPREVGDLLALATLARVLGELHRRLAAAPAELDAVRELAADVPDTAGLASWVFARLGSDGQVLDDATPELRRLRRQTVTLRLELSAELESIRRRHPEAATDAPPTLRRDRYCIPVRAGARGQLEGLVLASSGSGATVFVEPFAAVERNNALADTVAREAEEVARILSEIASALGGARNDLRRGRDAAAELDAAQARAAFGRTVGGRLVVPEGEDLVLRAARHPLLDERLAAVREQQLGAGPPRSAGRRVVPLDLELPRGIRILVISGPNAGGKTVALKTVGLMVLMASHGIPLPAAAGTAIPALRELWAHVGDEQDVASDLSTFSAAMSATSSLLSRADSATLALYDELGAGTDPLEGSALGCALLEELGRRRTLTVATTHLAAIAMTADADGTMENAAMEYDEAAGRPTFTLRVGRPGRSRALEIADRMGVSGAVLDRARTLLGDHQLELDRWLERLEAQEAELERARSRAEAERLALERGRREADAERGRLETERASLPQRLAEERERLRRRAKTQLDEALARLDRAVAEARQLGRRQRQKLRDAALDLEPPEAPGTPAPGAVVEPGARVRLTTLGAAGELVEVRGSRALVAVTGKRLWVGTDELRPTGEPAAAPPPPVRVEAEDPGAGELLLLGLDAEAARELLETFLDRSLAAGRRAVRIVHGHGTGTLRRMVAEVCRTHPAVRSFAHPPQSRGGTGATEVDLSGPGDG